MSPSPRPPIIYNIGVDEAGRGPLFGRVYAAAVVLPSDESMDFSCLKDSKKFHSKRKINAVADYIKTKAFAWAVCFEEASAIDQINIRRATFRAMHSCIREILSKLDGSNYKNTMLWIDGNDFEPYVDFSTVENKLCVFPHLTIVGGDDARPEISAASILAKTTRDAYIAELCAQRPELIEKYALDKNQGYGTAKHIEGIKKYGITDLHRQTFTTKWTAAAKPPPAENGMDET